MDRRAILAIIAAAVVAFLIGFVWQYTGASAARSQLQQVERELTFQRMQSTLGAATVEAQRGSYEIARQLASSFFSALQNDIAQAPPEAAAELRDILLQRDAMITALSRNDPQSGAMLAQLFLRFRAAMGEPVGPGVGTAPAPAPAPDTAAEPDA
jgi:hypothetical protein